jgi:hypothetical protein
MGRSRGHATFANASLVLSLVLALSPLAYVCGGCSFDNGFTRQLAPMLLPSNWSLAADAATSRQCESRVAQANAAFEQRKHLLIQRFVEDLARDGLGDFLHDPSSDSFRRIAAGLSALEQQRVYAREQPTAPPLFDPGVPADFPARVETFTRSLYDFRPGTVGGLPAEPGDYDFLMKEMISLLYVFRDQPELLTDEAAFRIVDSALGSLAGLEDVEDRLSFRVSVPLIGALLEYPETENHVLMTLSSIYLTNQWIVENPRHDRRLRKGHYSHLERFDNQGSELEDMLLQATGRVLHSGFWEVNGRPYQAMTAHALMNLSSFAGSETVRTAARNALDYLSTQFAFQSFEMKRLGPYRRSVHYVTTTGMYDNDGVIFIFGALAGGYVWPDAFFRSGNAAGHALWATLLDYRVPPAVHDFMLDKHSGFWSRMQTRFGAQDYGYGRPGRYFTDDGQALTQGEPQFLQELYFVTPRFLNAAGGSFQRHDIMGDLFIGNDGVHDLDFLSRPSAILARGHLSQWSDLTQMTNEVLAMPGEARFWQSDNSGTYKSFSYGYFHDGDKDRHLDSPLRIPGNMQPYLYREGKRALFSNNRDSRLRVSFLDLSAVERFGYYVVLGRMSKSENSRRYRYYARGFWEVVPRERFGSVQALKDYVLHHNPDSAWSDATDGPHRYYRYTMTTGEILELNDRLGVSEKRCENPIRRIWPAGADPDKTRALPLSELTFDRCDRNAIARMPLLEAREVDHDFSFTGRRLAYAAGDGQLWVDNPYLGAGLWLDSRDYRHPKRTETQRSVAGRSDSLKPLDSLVSTQVKPAVPP